MKSLFEHLAAWCNAMSAGSFIGGVLFNTIGMRQDLQFAGFGVVLSLSFLLLGCFFKLKGGK
ncbi:MAG: hypothetical protein FWE23_06370 [Chitinivibrionia bacterium]|nr:hypothetical protein [Chitinivibrionia bacterium]